MKVKVNRIPSFLKGKQGVLEYNLNQLVTEHSEVKTVIENVLRKNGIDEAGIETINYDDKEYLVRILVVGDEVCAVEIGSEGDEWTLKKKE